MADVKVHFLGSGDAFGSGGRLQTCIYVNTEESHFLMDCGATSLSGMKHWDLSPVLVDAILVTHIHGDHFGGIPFFILDAHLISRRIKPLIIAGPPGLEARIRDAQEALFPGSSTMKLRFTIDYVELQERAQTPIGPLAVTAYPVIHHASGALAYALQVQCSGKIIAYSGDTEWTDTLIQASRGADLFICEANFFDKKVRFHLDYATLIEHRHELDCQRLIITHMGDNMLEQLDNIQVEAAQDGKQVLI